MVSTFLALFHESIGRRFLPYIDREVMFFIFSVHKIASKTASELLPTLNTFCTSTRWYHPDHYVFLMLPFAYHVKNDCHITREWTSLLAYKYKRRTYASYCRNNEYIAAFGWGQN